MINKRTLIKNLLAQHDENTFYEKKESIDLKTDEGKGKFLKHVCALSNSNPENNSYLIVGIENRTSEIKGFNFFDDSNVQNLVSSYLSNPPNLKYENIYFPNLSKDKVIGLLTIYPSKTLTSFRKNISNFSKGSCYYRKGSNSLPLDDKYSVEPSNIMVVADIEKYSKMSFKVLLDDVFDFYRLWSPEYHPQYLVFKDQYVICWAGYRTKYGEIPMLSEVDIRIVNEASRLFYSAAQWVDIKTTDSEFVILEYKVLGFDNNFTLYPFEETKIVFHENGNFNISTEIIFNPPKFDNDAIKVLYYRTKDFESKIVRGDKIDYAQDLDFYLGIANYFLICYFNGINEAKKDLLNSSKYLDGAAGEWQSECVEILEKFENKSNLR
jgi:hypothetical protein